MEYGDKKNPGDRLTSEDWNALAADVTNSVRKGGDSMTGSLRVEASPKQEGVMVHGEPCLGVYDQGLYDGRPLRVSGEGAVLALEGEKHAYMEFYPDGYAVEEVKDSNGQHVKRLSRRAWIGYGNEKSQDLSLCNEYEGGFVHVLGKLRAQNDLLFVSTASTAELAQELSSQVVPELTIGDVKVTRDTDFLFLFSAESIFVEQEASVAVRRFSIGITLNDGVLNSFDVGLPPNDPFLQSNLILIAKARLQAGVSYNIAVKWAKLGPGTWSLSHHKHSLLQSGSRQPVRSLLAAELWTF